MMRFQKNGIRVYLNPKSIYAYVNHPNMGRLLLFKIDRVGFYTPLTTSESWIKNMLTSAGIVDDSRIKDNCLFNTWFHK
jgi:hypothetical protein